MKVGSGSFRERVVARLRYLIELKGKSVTGIEKELGRGRGYLGDALRGDKRLPIEMLQEVLALLEITPEAFFAGRTEEERRWASGAAQGRERSRAPDYAAPRARGQAEVAEGAARDAISRLLADASKRRGEPDARQLGRLMLAVVTLLDRKGYVTAAELQREFTGRG
jgi:transcriptional regulator with XRE-family HTH domain